MIFLRRRGLDGGSYDFDRLVDADSGDVDHQVVVAGVSPPLSGVTPIMVDPFLVYSVDFLFGFRREEVVFAGNPADGGFDVGIYKDTEAVEILFEQEVGQTSDDYARPLCGKPADDAAFGNKDGIVVG